MSEPSRNRARKPQSLALDSPSTCLRKTEKHSSIARRTIPDDPSDDARNRPTIRRSSSTANTSRSSFQPRSNLRRSLSLNSAEFVSRSPMLYHVVDIDIDDGNLPGKSPSTPSPLARKSPPFCHSARADGVGRKSPSSPCNSSATGEIGKSPFESCSNATLTRKSPSHGRSEIGGRSRKSPPSPGSDVFDEAGESPSSPLSMDHHHHHHPLIEERKSPPGTGDGSCKSPPLQHSTIEEIHRRRERERENPPLHHSTIGEEEEEVGENPPPSHHQKRTGSDRKSPPSYHHPRREDWKSPPSPTGSDIGGGNPSRRQKRTGDGERKSPPSYHQPRPDADWESLPRLDGWKSPPSPTGSEMEGGNRSCCSYNPYMACFEGGGSRSTRLSSCGGGGGGGGRLKRSVSVGQMGWRRETESSRRCEASSTVGSTASSRIYQTPTQRKEVATRELRTTLTQLTRELEGRELLLQDITEIALEEKEEIYTEFQRQIQEAHGVAETARKEMTSLKESHEHSVKMADALEQEIEDVKKEMDKKLSHAEQVFLAMYNKGRESAIFEMEEELELQTKAAHAMSPKEAELRHQLRMTQAELAKWQTLQQRQQEQQRHHHHRHHHHHRRHDNNDHDHLHHSTASLPAEAGAETEAEATLAFLGDAMFHFLTSEKSRSSDEHLRAVVGILNFSDKQRGEIAEAILSKRNKSVL